MSRRPLIEQYRRLWGAAATVKRVETAVHELQRAPREENTTINEYTTVNEASGAGATDHGALTGLADDDHPQYATDTDLSTHAAAADPHTVYVREADANWIDLTDGGASTLHSHAGGGAYSYGKTIATSRGLLL